MTLITFFVTMNLPYFLFQIFHFQFVSRQFGFKVVGFLGHFIVLIFEEDDQFFELFQFLDTSTALDFPGFLMVKKFVTDRWTVDERSEYLFFHLHFCVCT